MASVSTVVTVRASVRPAIVVPSEVLGQQQWASGAEPAHWARVTGCNAGYSCGAGMGWWCQSGGCYWPQQHTVRHLERHAIITTYCILKAWRQLRQDYKVTGIIDKVLQL